MVKETSSFDEELELTEKEQQEFLARNQKEAAELERRRAIAENYVTSHEHGNSTVEEVAGRHDIHVNTLYNWVANDREFYELLLEARNKVGNAVGDLSLTNICAQILEYQNMLDETDPKPSAKMRMEIMREIAKLSNLYQQKTYEQQQADRPQELKERLRQQMLGMLRNAAAHDPTELQREPPKENPADTA